MSDTTSSMPTPKGHVIAQEEATGKGPTGTYVPGVNVTAVLDGVGTAFTVFVPNDQYTPQGVQAALAARAAQLAAVSGLTFGG